MARTGCTAPAQPAADRGGAWTRSGPVRMPRSSSTSFTTSRFSCSSALVSAIGFSFVAESAEAPRLSAEGYYERESAVVVLPLPLHRRDHVPALGGRHPWGSPSGPGSRASHVL